MIKARFVINGKEITTINEIPEDLIKFERQFKKNIMTLADNFGADITKDSYSLEYDVGEGFKIIYAKSKELSI